MQSLWIFLLIPLFLLQHIETMKMISMLDTKDCWSGRLLKNFFFAGVLKKDQHRSIKSLLFLFVFVGVGVC